MYESLTNLLREGNRIVFFGGAGVSTESGIPDCRSVNGLYRQTYRFPPETILSHTFFRKHPEEFFHFYRERMLCLSAQPNQAHRALAKLEQMGKLSAIITQNIDGLHQSAGSQKVYELHGSVLRNTCLACRKTYPVTAIVSSQGIPTCSCGGIIKPDVVLYEESLDSTTVAGAIQAIAQADLLIIGGTSLTVYPAAGLIDSYSGRDLVLINQSQTSADERATLCFHAPIGDVLGQAVQCLTDVLEK